MLSATKIGSKRKLREKASINVLWSDLFNSLMAEGLRPGFCIPTFHFALRSAWMEAEMAQVKI
jgi:hypothetical protein